VLVETILADPRVSDALQEILTATGTNDKDPLLRRRIERTWRNILLRGPLLRRSP
jgi:hypothetical protein